MRFLLDMGISFRLVSYLTERGHEAVHLETLGLRHLPDSEILAKARTEDSVILTHDLDFPELLAAGGFELPSVVLFRLQDMRPANLQRLISRVLERCLDDLQTGAVVSVTEQAIRIRKLPIRR